MKMKFTVTEYVKGYSVPDYKQIELSKVYTVNSFDDLQDLILMLVDFSRDEVKFSIKKEVIDEQ